MFLALLILLLLFIFFYHRFSLALASIITAVVVVVSAYWHGITSFSSLLSLTVTGGALLVLNLRKLRRGLISRHILRFFRSVMPRMSDTEREALEAGNVWWEKELFCGKPNWQFFNKIDKPKLSVEEEAFLNGPVEELCESIDDWQITQKDYDLPASMWTFLREKGFFGLLIPTKYGGKGFSALLHSELITKVAPLSSTVASTITVPNSLGPAELLLRYGTQQQKNYYLPRLACGAEIPCFALTGIESGSDAATMQDIGIVTKQVVDGEEVLGFRLSMRKRYITLAPVASLIGVAFRLRDPERLISEKEEIGITCALIERQTPGLQIGRRHFPLNTPFQNGPIEAENIFISMEAVIGGQAMVGLGWRMLMTCLAEGRSISLPAISAGCARMAAVASGSYCRIRKQFGMPLSFFEGIKEPLGRMGALSYTIDAARKMAAGAVASGEKSAVLAAIAKYHITEEARKIFATDAMDVHAGKAICLGPKNYMGRSYQAAPIAITVEGANILTRSMIIFGQGAMRCHPYIYKEYNAARLSDRAQRLIQFDAAFFGHVGFLLSNIVRSLTLSLSRGYVGTHRNKGALQRYYQLVDCYSANLAIIADMSLIILGGKLKRLEALSSRLGDILSYLLLTTAVLKRYENEGCQQEDLPLVHWSAHYFLYRTEQSLNDFLVNFPYRGLSVLLRIFVLPHSLTRTMPSDALTHQVADILADSNKTRQRLMDKAYIKPSENNCIGIMEQVLLDCLAAEEIEFRLSKAVKQGNLKNRVDYFARIDLAVEKGLINKEEAKLVKTAHRGRLQVINVDSFTNEELFPQAKSQS